MRVREGVCEYTRGDVCHRVGASTVCVMLFPSYQLLQSGGLYRHVVGISTSAGSSEEGAVVSLGVVSCGVRVRGMFGLQ